MKSLSLISTATLCLAAMSCSTAASPPADNGGTSAGGAGNAGSTSTGGSPGGAGASTSGGMTSGGAVGTTGGTDGTGLGGSGGAATSAGASGAPVSTGGSSGSGVTAGSGGSSGSGTAGTAGMVGTAGGGSTLDPTAFAGDWDGALLQFPCGSGSPNYDCQEPTPCTGVSASQQNAPIIKPAGGAASSWVMKGTTGTNYNVKVRIQGVTEVSWYHGGTRSAGTSSVDVGSTVPGAQSYAKDLFQTGGMPLTYADQGNGFDYNQYELDVTPAGGGAPSVYFLNAVIPTENPHTSSKTQHLSFQIDEQPTIMIPGGATVSLTVRDSNCVEIQNCGTQNSSAQCQNGARSVSLAGSMPAPPASWTGKVTSGTGNTLGGQFVHFDVLSVTVAP